MPGKETLFDGNAGSVSYNIYKDGSKVGIELSEAGRAETLDYFCDTKDHKHYVYRPNDYSVTQEIASDFLRSGEADEIKQLYGRLIDVYGIDEWHAGDIFDSIGRMQNIRSDQDYDLYVWSDFDSGTMEDLKSKGFTIRENENGTRDILFSNKDATITIKDANGHVAIPEFEVNSNGRDFSSVQRLAEEAKEQLKNKNVVAALDQNGLKKDTALNAIKVIQGCQSWEDLQNGSITRIAANEKSMEADQALTEYGNLDLNTLSSEIQDSLNTKGYYAAGNMIALSNGDMTMIFDTEQDYFSKYYSHSADNSQQTFDKGRSLLEDFRNDESKMGLLRAEMAANGISLNGFDRKMDSWISSSSLEEYVQMNNRDNLILYLDEMGLDGERAIKDNVYIAELSQDMGGGHAVVLSRGNDMIYFKGFGGASFSMNAFGDSADIQEIASDPKLLSTLSSELQKHGIDPVYQNEIMSKLQMFSTNEPSQVASDFYAGKFDFAEYSARHGKAETQEMEGGTASSLSDWDVATYQSSTPFSISYDKNTDHTILDIGGNKMVLTGEGAERNDLMAAYLKDYRQNSKGLLSEEQDTILNKALERYGMQFPEQSMQQEQLYTANAANYETRMELMWDSSGMPCGYTIGDQTNNMQYDLNSGATTVNGDINIVNYHLGNFQEHPEQFAGEMYVVGGYDTIINRVLQANRENERGVNYPPLNI